MAKMRQILIIGNNDNGCTPELEKIAYDAGKHVVCSLQNLEESLEIQLLNNS